MTDTNTHQSRNNARFAGGRLGATFLCESCGRNTRDTGHNEGNFRMCKKCLFTAYAQNCHSDNGHEGEFRSCQDSDCLSYLRQAK